MAKKQYLDLAGLETYNDEIQAQLASKANSSHNHSASNITSGTLSSDRLPTVPIAKGGTGATTAAGALTNLGLTATAAELNKMDGVTATTTELNYIDGVTSNIQAQLDSKSDSGHNHIYYGVCETAADTVAKTVTGIDNFSLVEGATVIVKFTYANSVASPTLNVNSTGAKPIYRYGTTVASTGTTTTGWRAGAVQMFTYDGTGWVRDFWENTTYSNVGLGQGYCTCSTAAATAAKTASLSSYALTTGGIVAVKFTYDVPASATLNINSKGAKSIYYNGAAITAGVIKAGDTATFIYSSQYHLIGINRDLDVTHPNVTAGSVGSAQSPSHGGTFAIPKITYDANGHITAASTVNITLPADNNTDTKVTQTVTTSNATYPLLLAPNGQTATKTTTSYFDSGVTLNPSTNTIAANVSGSSASCTGNAATATTAEKADLIKYSEASNNANYALLFGGNTTYSTALYNSSITVNPSTNTITATTFKGALSGNATTATTATKLGTATKGSATNPIYLSSGTATECTTYAGGTAVTLNNYSKAGSTASFYAPTAGGTSGYVLVGAGTTTAPIWKSLSDAGISSTSHNHNQFYLSNIPIVTTTYSESEDKYYFRPHDDAFDVGVNLGSTANPWGKLVTNTGQINSTLAIDGITTISARIQPKTNEAVQLGTSSLKFLAVYCKNSAMTTSDLNRKRNIKAIDDKYIELFDKVQPCTYMFDNGDRVHTGFISQYVEDTMKEVGLTAEELGFFCRDIKTESVYDEDGNFIENKDMLDKDGNPIYEYGLRYSEYIAIMAEKIKRLEAKYNIKLTELDAKLAELDAKLG